MQHKSDRTFSINADGNGDKIDVRITELAGASAQNLSLATWAAATVLANILHRINVFPDRLKSEQSSSRPDGTSTPSPTVLELGAGTGLVGLTAALLWKTGVILTDLPGIVPGLAANVTINEDLIRERGAAVQCGTLDWYHPDVLQLQGQSASEDGNDSSKFSVLIAADTCYSEEQPELITNVILNRMSREQDSRFVMIYPLRIAYLDHIREMWERLEGAGLVTAEDAQEPPIPDWDEEAPYEWSVWKWKATG